VNPARSLLAGRRLVWACRIATGALMLAAALSKIGESAEFVRQIHHLRFAPFGLENLIAITVPWVELVAALAILSGVEPRGGTVLAAGFLALFVVVVIAAMARRLDVECGCFGTADATRVGATKLIENLTALAVASIGSQRVVVPDGNDSERGARVATTSAGAS
jgi:uncharacterized membrane protein YphA (DoxX/SURF4 family)